MSIFNNMMGAGKGMYDMFSGAGNNQIDSFSAAGEGQGMIESALMEQMQGYGQPGPQAGTLGGMPGRTGGPAVEVDEMQNIPSAEPQPFQDLQGMTGNPMDSIAGGIAKMFMSGGGGGGMGGMMGGMF